MGAMQKETSIRVKLIRIFAIVAAAIFIINMGILTVQNRTVSQIDQVYASNIELNELSETLSRLETSLYRYLATKSSDELENYYTYEQEYRDMLEQLNRNAADSPGLLAEKNIYYMSQSYLEAANETIEDKRARNISGYKEGYACSQKISRYLQDSINSLNNTVFQENSRNYLRLRNILDQATTLSFLLLLAVMAGALMWIAVKIRSFTRPLAELADVANLIARGDMAVDFPVVETNDEITTVAKACNKMMESIRRYIQETKENYERESQLIENELIMKNDLKEAQLKYLQAQIDPHFLFNSLNAGAQLAMMEGAERACLYIENLADFFRYNVRKMEESTTLREETELIDHYIYIMNVRFSGEIHYYKQIDERLWDVRMPGMILQPIIENSVKHGISGMEGEGEIRLSIYGEGDLVNIRIQDNGTGIEPETAERIMRGERAHGEGSISTGIGMDNVISRLRRYYDREHVLDIRRRETGGTEIILYITREKGDADDQNTDM